MRRQGLAALLGLMLFGGAAQAQQAPGTYSGSQYHYTTPDVLTVLGKAQSPTSNSGLNFSAEVSGGVSTKLSCGRIGVNLNLNTVLGHVREIPAQLAGQAQNLLWAMPMLTICYAWPSLCAELKSVNFQVSERLKERTDLCRSIDGYINDQVRDGAKKRGFEKCVQDRLATNGDDAYEAQDYCNTQPGAATPFTYTNLASAWLRDETTTAPQKILASLFQASGQYVQGSIGDKEYAFVSSVLGELKLDVNGKVLPVFPAHPMTVSQLSDNLMALGVNLASDQVRLDQVRQGTTSTATPDALRFQEQQLFDVVHENIEHENVLDLFSLDPPDRAVACNALGRSLARAALRRCGENARALTATALQNPGLPDQLRETYQARASQTFQAMVSAAEADREHSIPTIKRIIRDMARVKQQRTEAEAAAVSKTQQDMEEEFANTPCDSEETCRP